MALDYTVYLVQLKFFSKEAEYFVKAPPGVPSFWTANSARIKHLTNQIVPFEQQYFTFLASEDLEKEAIDNLTSAFENFRSLAFSAKAMYDLNSPSDPVQVVIDEPSRRNNLPKLKLPIFCGEVTEFLNFQALFQSMVIDDLSLTNIQRLQYLKTSLEGEPLKLIQSLSLNNDNFLIAWETIMNKYLDKRHISTKLWNQIAHHPPVKNNYQSLNNFLTVVTDNLNGLAALDHPVEAWSFIVLTTLLEKLDKTLAENFEMSHNDKIPSVSTLLDFLTRRCKAVSVESPIVAESKPWPKSFAHKSHLTSSVDMASCPECQQAHGIFRCPKFLQASASDRYQIAKKLSLCKNCLQPSHGTKECPSTNRCKICKKLHNSLLHFPGNNDILEVSTPKVTESENQFFAAATHLNMASSVMLLPTVLLEVADASGKAHLARALLDTASTCSLITKEFAQLLGVNSRPVQSTLHGTSGATVAQIQSVYTLCIRPRNQTHPTFTFDAYEVESISGPLPAEQLPPHLWTHVEGLTLADPTFGLSAPVQLMLSVDIVSKMISGNKRTGPEGTPIAIHTSFGWVLGGLASLPVQTPRRSHLEPSAHLACHLTMHTTLESIMRAFWASEEPPDNQVKMLNQEDRWVEETFKKNVYHNAVSRRYVVPLPFKENPPHLGDSYHGALSCFYSLERRFFRNPDLHQEYKKFMSELIEQHIIELVPDQQKSHVTQPYYLPHHGVVKKCFLNSCVSNKLRVVFNGSFRSSNGKSLNDCLLSGPKLHSDIVNVILNFRLYPVILIADIQQMFHQIEVRPEFTDFLRLFWRFDRTQPVSVYRMNRVPFGLKPSPYLAIRTLKMLADDYSSEFGVASGVIQRGEIYVDDVLTGAPTVAAAQELQNELSQLMSHGGFKLAKWASNYPEVLKNVPEHLQQQVPISIDDTDSQSLKVLGLCYNPCNDSFSYNFTKLASINTKRGILSDMARHYDPMGWISPTIFLVKLILRNLAELKLGWDDPVPIDTMSEWEAFKEQLPLLQRITIPRLVLHGLSSCQLLGFSDSSEKGYSAAIYLRQQVSSRKFQTALLFAKTRVGPLDTISLPRMELNGAVLLAKSIAHLQKQFSGKIIFDEVRCYTDSTIVLYWIQSHSSRWQTYIANRVTQIHDLTQVNQWHHIRSEFNPADCASRGLMPADIVHHTLWWHGPGWLENPIEGWPAELPLTKSSLANWDLEEKPSKGVVLINVEATSSKPIEQRYECLRPMLERISSLLILQRSTARIIRLFRSRTPDITPSFLSSAELNHALMIWVEIVQREAFFGEIRLLKNNQPIVSKLARLDLFLLEENNVSILRVGGRIQHAKLSSQTLHPILLPQKHRLTELIISFYHHTFGHPGAQALQCMIGRRFWIVNARSAIRMFTLRCITCFKVKPPITYPFMSHLPDYRVQQVKVFARTGMDYAGPISIRSSKLRKAPQQKAYVCVFVCMVTKACHLEAVSDLSTNAFLAALQRFVSRRGRCSELFSDCGTNFVGADREIARFWKTSSNLNSIAAELAVTSIKFHFNPPASPHFGGLWEALVKSVKHHLIRIIGSQILTFEELSTVLCSIEGYLNSRPLVPMSNDPSDMEVLTPGHFLTMEPLTAFPQPIEEVSRPPVDLRNRWRLVRHLHQQFWQRWSNEYLTTLQVRQKWSKKFCNIQEGDLILLKEDNVPPLTWRRGRVVKVHPGQDGVVRVATIQTSSGQYIRPVVRLAPLPLPNDAQPSYC